MGNCFGRSSENERPLLYKSRVSEGLRDDSTYYHARRGRTEMRVGGKSKAEVKNEDL